MKRLLALAALVLAGTSWAEPLTVLMGTGDPDKGIKPSIFASGKVEVRVPTLDELGLSLIHI